MLTKQTYLVEITIVKLIPQINNNKIGNNKYTKHL